MPTAELAGAPGPRFTTSRAQAEKALAAANTVRLWRANLKRDIRAGRRDVAALLADPPPELLTMPILTLVMAMPRVGRKAAGAALQRAQLAPMKQVGELTDRQRAQLAAALPRREHTFV